MLGTSAQRCPSLRWLHCFLESGRTLGCDRGGVPQTGHTQQWQVPWAKLYPHKKYVQGPQIVALFGTEVIADGTGCDDEVGASPSRTVSF